MLLAACLRLRVVVQLLALAAVPCCGMLTGFPCLAAPLRLLLLLHLLRAAQGRG